MKVYFLQLREVLFHPTRFFARIHFGESAYDALTFGIVTTWWVNGLRYLVGMESSFMGSFPILKMATGLGAVILTPFLLAFKITVWALILWVSLALLLPESGKTTLRLSPIFCILGYAMSAHAVMLIPWVGAAIAPIWIAVLVWCGIKECFAVSGLRAWAVLAFPYLIFGVLFGIAAIFFGLILFQMIAAWILPLIMH